MILRLNWRRGALALASLILGLTLMGAARAATVLSAGSVQKLVVVEDSANFLTQVALMAGQVPQIKGITSDQKSGLIQGSWSDVQTAAAALEGVPQVTGAASTNKAVGGRIVKATGTLSADITNLGAAVTANPLSAATQKAFQKLGRDATALENEIQRDFAMLPAAQRPVALSLDPAAGQARVFAANATVKFVLSGPKAAMAGGNGTWALTSGRQDPSEPPLSTPFVADKLAGSSASAKQAMHATATEWGAWTYIYYQYGVRRPTLLLLNLGSAAGGNLTDGNATDGGSLDTGSITQSNTFNGTLTISGNNSLTLAGNISDGTGSVTKTGDGTAVLSGSNTYTGGTVINGGAIQFSSASSLGTTTDANLIINGGTLRYVGSGNSSDRLLTVGSNGGTIDASGSGPINFTNPGNLSLTGSAPTTVTFAGDNTGNNTFASNITDQNGASISVSKNGSGIWVLTGNNTYTGNTTIAAGMLVATNLWLPPGDIFVTGTGTFVYQPDGNDSLTVSAVAADGSAYPWGDTTYEVDGQVDGQVDGSWVVPALNLQIVSVTGGYEISPWVAPEIPDSNITFDNTVPSNTADAAAIAFALNATDNNSAMEWVSTISNSALRQQIANMLAGNWTVRTLSGNLGINPPGNFSLTLPNPVVVDSGVTDLSDVSQRGLGHTAYFVTGTGELTLTRLPPSEPLSFTVRAVPVAGSAYPWGDFNGWDVSGAKLTVTTNADGSWSVPLVGFTIKAVNNGYLMQPGL